VLKIFFLVTNTGETNAETLQPVTKRHSWGLIEVSGHESWTSAPLLTAVILHFSPFSILVQQTWSTVTEKASQVGIVTVSSFFESQRKISRQMTIDTIYGVGPLAVLYRLVSGFYLSFPVFIASTISIIFYKYLFIHFQS